MVVGLGVRNAWLDEGRNDHCAYPPTTRAEYTGGLCIWSYRLTTTGMSISVFASKIGFVERDYQHSILLVCLRIHDERDFAPEKRVDGGQSSRRLAVGTLTIPMVMSVVAKVGNDEGQVRRAFDGVEIALELIKRYIVGLAIFITDGMKVHKGIVLGCVLTVASSSFMAIHFAQWWMLAGALHIFHVTAPFQDVALRADLAIVLTSAGYTHPCPTACPFASSPGLIKANSLNIGQSCCVSGLGDWPLIIAM